MLTSFFAPRAWSATALALLLGLSAARAHADSYDDAADPPDRVARLSYLGGQVSFQPGGDSNWVQASLNRPLVTGDALYTDRNSRTELQLGGAVVRLDERSSATLLNLDDRIAQLQLSEGVLNLRVRNLREGESYEIDTPTLAFVTTMPGEYRIDIAPDGRSTMVTVFDGRGEVYGENNASRGVRAGSTYRFNDSALRDYEELDLPRPDDFDNWVASRQRAYTRSVSSRYVAEDMIGVSDLDDAGSWVDESDYGPVWYPTRVAVDYVPYRNGHWSWIDPWGWTWIDNASWGFAPFHYGRWVYVGHRWGWCPGPRHVRAIYAPAMVAFIGNVSIRVGGPVGWFPLGPRDVYVPWYHTSHRYFTNINVHNTTIINNVHITNIYNDYSRGRPITGIDYAYRANASALTAMSREAFVGARPVSAGRVQVDAAQWRNAPIASRLGIAPTQASFVAADARRASAVPTRAVADRHVIARTAPPPQVTPIAARVQAIQRNDAQPLSRPAYGRLAAEQGTQAPPARVRVVGSEAVRPQVQSREAMSSGSSRRPGVGGDAGSAMPSREASPATSTRAPMRVPQQESDRALPSSRFAPHSRVSQDGASSRTQELRPPASRTLERSVPASDNAEPASSRFGRGSTSPSSTSAPTSREIQRPDLRSRESDAVAPQRRIQSREETQPSYRSRDAEPSTPTRAPQPQFRRESVQPSYRSRSEEVAEPPRRSQPAADYGNRGMQPSYPSRNDTRSDFRSRESAPVMQQSMPMRQAQPSYQPRNTESYSAPQPRMQQRAPQPAMQQPMPQQRMAAPQQQREAPARRAAPEQNRRGEDRQ